jgi:hypothetical protein
MSQSAASCPGAISILAMTGRRDARTILEALVGKTIHTLTGRQNVVVGIEGDEVRVGTSRSPGGQNVPIRWIQDALDQLAAEGTVDISVESVGYRSGSSVRC